MQSQGLARFSKTSGAVVVLVLWLALPRECDDPGVVWVCIAALAGLNFLLRKNSGITCEYCRSVCYMQVLGHILQGRSSGCCCGASANPRITKGSGLGGSAAQSYGDGRSTGIHRGMACVWQEWGTEAGRMWLLAPNGDYGVQLILRKFGHPDYKHTCFWRCAARYLPLF